MSETVSETDVLIVGAGPTGLTLACDLARRGVALRVVDAAPRPFVGSRGKGLQPRTLEVFEALGVLDEVLAAGARYPRVKPHVWRFALGSWAMHATPPPSPGVPHPETWLVPQARTEGILRARLERTGRAVEHGVSCMAIAQDDDGATATLARDRGAIERVRARYVVGADGGRSTVRKALGVAFAGRAFEGERMLVGDVRVEGLDRAYWHVWPRARGGGMVALCPLPGGDAFQLMVKLAPGCEPPALDGPSVARFVARATWNPRGVRLCEATWLSLYRPHVRMVDRYRVGRVFLAGDAAHVHPPEGGQGLNTGVQDAYNLGWKLARVLDGAAASLLDTYEAERLPIAASVLGLSARLHRGGARTARRGAATQQLGLGYRGGPLADEARARPGVVRAGDRAPDAPCVDARGRPTRLFDAFRGGHATLLAFGGGHRATLDAVRARYAARVRAFGIARPGEAVADDALLDAHGHARRGYGVADDALVLVRPDGYVGVFASPGRLDAIEIFLARV